MKKKSEEVKRRREEMKKDVRREMECVALRFLIF